MILLYNYCSMVEKKFQKKAFSTFSKSAILASILSAIFLVTCMFGEGLSGSWGSNNSCLPYVGCSDGFFGYDAIEHFLFGVAIIWVLIWIFERFPKLSLKQPVRWKNVFTLISTVALISVFWEFGECAHDYFRLDVLHQPLLNLKLHINHLDQPSNLDTMGDFAFALFGAFISVLFTGKHIKADK